MNTLLPDETQTDNENVINTLENDRDGSDEDDSQTSSKDKRFNISARRKIEDYLENRRLASLTNDFLFEE